MCLAEKIYGAISALQKSMWGSKALHVEKKSTLHRRNYVDRETGIHARSYYRFVFRLPETRHIYVLLLALLAAYTALLLAFPEYARSGLLLVLFHASAVIIASHSGKSPLRRTRRYVAVIALSVFFGLIALALAAIAGSPPKSLGTALYILFFSTALIVNGLSGLKPALIYMAIMLLSLPFVEIGIAFSLVISSFIIFFILLYNILLKEDLVVAHAFLKSILDDDYSDLEKIVWKHSEEHELPIRLVALRSKNNCIVMVLPKLHFGPFRDAFSSSLPYMLEEKIVALKEFGTKILVFHSDVDHSFNLASRSIAEYVAEIVSNEIKWLCRSKAATADSLEIIAPARFECNGFRCTFLPSIIPLIVVERPGSGIDDFVLFTKMSHIGFIDAHNEEETIPLSNSEVESLGKEVSRLVKKAEKMTYNKCSIGYLKIPISEEAKRRLSLCKNWIKIFTAKCDNKEIYLVLVPSNNAEPGVRKEFEEYIKKYFPEKLVLIVTIDDHTCSGIAPGQPSYVLRNGRLLAEIVAKHIPKLLKNSEKIENVIEEIVLVKVRIWGKSLEKLRKAASSGALKAGVYLAVWLALLVIGFAIALT